MSSSRIYALFGALAVLFVLGFVILNSRFNVRLNAVSSQLHAMKTTSSRLAAATTPREQPASLEMQRKCAERAEKYFRSSGFAAHNGDYTDHYSVPLGHCFVTLIIMGNGRRSSSLTMAVHDAFEGTLLGQFTQFRDNGTARTDVLLCSVTRPNGVSRSCHSLDEWNAGVAEYR